MLRASSGKVVHTVKRAGTYAAKVPPQELHKIALPGDPFLSDRALKILSPPAPVQYINLIQFFGQKETQYTSRWFFAKNSYKQLYVRTFNNVQFSAVVCDFQAV
jgi:hypothetical protein